MEQFFKGNVRQKVDEGNLLFDKTIKSMEVKKFTFLKERIKILACKQPFDVIKVDCAKIIDDLQKTSDIK